MPSDSIFYALFYSVWTSGLEEGIMQHLFFLLCNIYFSYILCPADVPMNIKAPLLLLNWWFVIRIVSDSLLVPWTSAAYNCRLTVRSLEVDIQLR
jgi:hypothetical protein